MRNPLSAAAVIAFVFAPGCTQDVWQGVYYPQSDCLACERIYTPVAKSLDQCRAFIREIHAQRDDEVFDYECGLNCDYSGIDFGRCEGTAD